MIIISPETVHRKSMEITDIKITPVKSEEIRWLCLACKSSGGACMRPGKDKPECMKGLECVDFNVVV
jgi:hypothetical protein